MRKSPAMRRCEVLSPFDVIVTDASPFTAPGVLVGGERERAGTGGMVELQLLHPCELATGDHAPGQRVELAGVLVPQAEQAVGAVDVVGDDGRQAEVGQLQVGLELRIAHERGDAVGRSREVVVTLELHGVSLAAAPAVARLSVSRRLTRPVARCGPWSERICDPGVGRTRRWRIGS